MTYGDDLWKVGAPCFRVVPLRAITHRVAALWGATVLFLLEQLPRIYLEFTCSRRGCRDTQGAPEKITAA
jgi:hypothetical protein